MPEGGLCVKSHLIVLHIYSCTSFPPSPTSPPLHLCIPPGNTLQSTFQKIPCLIYRFYYFECFKRCVVYFLFLKENCSMNLLSAKMTIRQHFCLCGLGDRSSCLCSYSSRGRAHKSLVCSKSTLEYDAYPSPRLQQIAHLSQTCLELLHG